MAGKILGMFTGGQALLGIVLLAGLAIGLGYAKVPSFTGAVAGAQPFSAAATVEPAPSALACHLEGGQTLTTNVIASGVVLGQETVPIGGATWTGLLNGMIYTNQVAATAVTTDKGNNYSIYFDNGTTPFHRYVVSGVLPCNRDNFVIGEDKGGIKLAAKTGLTATFYDNDGLTSNAVLNETWNAGEAKTLRQRIITNMSYVGNAKGYFQNPQAGAGKIAVLVALNPNAGGDTMVGEIDTAQMSYSFGGVPCTAISSLFASNNNIQKAFACTVNINTGAPVDGYLYANAVAGQNPAGNFSIRYAPFEYYFGLTGITYDFEDSTGALTDANYALAAPQQYQIT